MYVGARACVLSFSPPAPSDRRRHGPVRTDGRSDIGRGRPAVAGIRPPRERSRSVSNHFVGPASLTLPRTETYSANRRTTNVAPDTEGRIISGRLGYSPPPGPRVRGAWSVPGRHAVTGVFHPRTNPWRPNACARAPPPEIRPKCRIGPAPGRLGGRLIGARMENVRGGHVTTSAFEQRAGRYRRQTNSFGRALYNIAAYSAHSTAVYMWRGTDIHGRRTGRKFRDVRPNTFTCATRGHNLAQRKTRCGNDGNGGGGGVGGGEWRHARTIRERVRKDTAGGKRAK